MPDNATTITIPAIEVEIDLSNVRQFRNGSDGRLIAISYSHEPYYPSQSGPVLHFELPDGRVVVTMPYEDFELRWKDTNQRAVVDEGAAEVVHILWDHVNGSFQDVLVEAFGKAAARALAKAFSST